MRKTIVFILLAAIGVAAGIFTYRQFVTPHLQQVVTAAPPIRFTTIDNKTLTLESLRGHWVLINFWASWCAPCMDELPHLVAAQSNYGALGLQIIGPALDEPDAVKPMLTRFHINYPVTADMAGGDAAMRALGNEQGALPFSVLVDPEGFVVQRVLGGMSADELRGMLEQHIRR